MTAVTVDQAASLRWSLLDRMRTLRVGLPLTSADVPTWVGPFVDRLNELQDMARADPRGAQPLSVDDVRDAIWFLLNVMQSDTVRPWIGLLASGGLQVNWRRGDVEVEAVFDRARDDRMVYVTVGEQEWEALVDEGYSLFSTVVERLSTADLERPAAIA